MDYVSQFDLCRRLQSWLISPRLEDDRTTQAQEGVPDTSTFSTLGSSYIANTSTTNSASDHDSNSTRKFKNIQLQTSNDIDEVGDSPEKTRIADSTATIQPSESLNCLQTNSTLFESFGHLPAELRIRIWKLNLPDPRNIIPHPDYIIEEVHGQSALFPGLDACFESKETISKIYPLCFEAQLLGKPIRFSPARDTIVFPNYRTMKDFYPHSWYGICTLTRSECQSFAVVKHLIVHYDFLLGLVLPFVERFDNLETLVVEGKNAWDSIANPPAVDEQAFMNRLRLLARKRGKEGSMPLVTFRISG